MYIARLEYYIMFNTVMKLNSNTNIFSLNISPVTQTRCITWVYNNQWNGVLTVHADIYAK